MNFNVKELMDILDALQAKYDIIRNTDDNYRDRDALLRLNDLIVKISTYEV